MNRVKGFPLLLTMLLVLSLVTTAYAAESAVIYQGHNLFGFGPGSTFSRTDLFPEFKDAMPGDVLTQTISVSNTASCCDFIRIYLRAETLGENDPLGPEYIQPGAGVTMEDFLSKLSMTVWNGGKMIYEGPPSEAGGLNGNVLLGIFRRYQGTSLTVQLTVPPELGNEYANRVGQVEWVFTVEEYMDADPNSPKTGDDSHILLYELLMAASGKGIVLLLVSKHRQRKKSTRC